VTAGTCSDVRRITRLLQQPLLMLMMMMLVMMMLSIMPVSMPPSIIKHRINARYAQTLLLPPVVDLLYTGNRKPTINPQHLDVPKATMVKFTSPQQIYNKSNRRLRFIDSISVEDSALGRVRPTDVRLFAL